MSVSMDTITTRVDGSVLHADRARQPRRIPHHSGASVDRHRRLSPLSAPA